MGMYIVDLVIIGMQIIIVMLMLRLIHGILECKREIKINRLKSLREVIKRVKKD